MKKILILLSTVVLFLASCDKDFQEINTNPQQVKSTNPGLLFSNALLGTPSTNWQVESTIIQQFVLPYNQGVTLGYQFNENVDGINGGPWNTFTGSLKNLEHILPDLKGDATRSNFYNLARIWRAYCYMWLVDHYGDVPYAEAGKAASTGTFYPVYEKDEAIYADIEKELKEATAALDAAKDNTSKYDIFIASTSTVAQEVTFWKRLGYSLLLRLGMRYSKLDATKAKSIVQAAFTGGVMQSNNDNVYIKYKTSTGAAITGYNNGAASGIRTTSYFYYVAKPLVDTLKFLSDPRLKYIAANYNPFQSTVANITNPDTIMANQFGFPVGYSDATISTSSDYRPPSGGSTGQNYSQVNCNVFGSPQTPQIILTYAQTSLLLAEAAQSGWLTGLTGAKTAKEYYEAGVRASMDSYTILPGTAPIPTSLQDAYLTMPGVAFTAGNELKVINMQYWIECFSNGYEGWCNFRRTGIPALKGNTWNSNLAGGFIRRFGYPLREQSANPTNYTAAVASLGGPDNLTTRIFWDK